MNPSFSSDWSREEKEEYATKRMNEMKLKNEKFKQRHEEVEKDRLEAEKKCSAVTSGAKIFLKTPDNIEEKATFHQEFRKQREWDIGKSTNEGDWYPPALQECNPTRDYHDSITWTAESRDRNPPPWQDHHHRSQDYHHSRPLRRGGFYDKRMEGQDNAWRSHGSRSGSYRGSMYRVATRGYTQSRSTAFQSGNVSNYSREVNKNNFKTTTESSSKTSSNWNDSKRNAFCSGNPYPKLVVKSTSDKMWHDDELNEVQNKQSRVEKWVKSINKVEDWSEGDEKHCKSLKNDGMSKSSENYQDKEQNSWNNERETDSGAKKLFTQNKTKYDKSFEHSFSKNVSTYDDKILNTSDLDYHGYVGKKTSSHCSKRDSKPKYNQGISSYDKTEASNLKSYPKIRKQSRFSKNKDLGADIWHYENVDKPKNKFSVSKVDDELKHIHSNENRDSRTAAWECKEAGNYDFKTRPEISKKGYNRKKDAEFDIWNDCDQINNWGTKEQDHSKGSDVIWDYGQEDDWNNKVANSDIKSSVIIQSSCKKIDSESIGWDYEKKDDLKTESETKENENYGLSNNFTNVMTDDKEAYGKDSAVICDYNYEDDWNNKIDSEFESIGWDYEKKRDIKIECETKELEDYDISNNFTNTMSDDKVATVLTSEKDEHKEYKEDIYEDIKEISNLTKGLNNLEIDFESIYEHKTNDSNETYKAKLESEANKCNESEESTFVSSNFEIIGNLNYKLAEAETKFTEYNYHDECDSAEPKL